MKLGALIAIICQLLTLLIEFARYFMTVFEYYNHTLALITWPVSLSLQSFAVLALALGILLDKGPPANTSTKV